MSDDRSPEEIVALAALLCRKAHSSIRDCRLRNAFRQTSRAERVLVLYDDRMTGRQVRLALGNLGIANEDVERLRIQADGKLERVAGEGC